MSIRDRDKSVGGGPTMTFLRHRLAKFMVHAIQNVHEALKLVLHVAMLVLMPSQILNLYLR